MIGPAFHPPAASDSFIVFGRMAPPRVERRDRRDRGNEEKESGTTRVTVWRRFFPFAPLGVSRSLCVLCAIAPIRRGMHRDRDEDAPVGENGTLRQAARERYH